MYLVLMPLKRNRVDVEHRSLGQVRFWLDDLEVIVRLIRGAMESEYATRREGQSKETFDDEKSVTIVIDDGDYSIDEVDDLEDYPSRLLNAFEVETAGGRVALRLSRQSALLTLVEPSLILSGMATEIERLARSRQRLSL